MAGSIILAFVIYMIYIGVLVNVEGYQASSPQRIGAFIVILSIIYVLNKIIKSRRARKEQRIHEEKTKVMNYAKGASGYMQKVEVSKHAAIITDSVQQSSSFMTNEEILQEAVAGYARETATHKDQNGLSGWLELLKSKMERFFHTASGNKIGSVILKILVIYMILSAIGMLVRLGGSSNAFSELYMELFFIVILFLVFRFASPATKPESKAFANAVYGRLVPREVAKVFPDAVYGRYDRMTLTDVKALNCFKRMFCEEGSGDEASKDFYLNVVRLETKNGHQISGTYDGVPFVVSYETIRGLYRTTKPQHGVEYVECLPGNFGGMCRDPETEREEMLFTGLMVRIPMRRNSAEPLGLVAASPAQVERELRSNRRNPDAEECGNRRLHTESEEFNRLFHIYGLDDENALFILTPDRMERLAAAYHGIYLTNEIDRHFKSMITAFYRDTMYLGIECTDSLFCFYENKMLTLETLAMIEQMAAEQAEMVRCGVEYARRIAGG